MISRTSSDEKPVRLVELFGLPGAGKTTVTGRVRLPGPFSTRENLSSAWRSLKTRHRLQLLIRIIGDWRWLAALAMLVIRTPIWRAESFVRLARIAAAKPWLRSQSGLIILDQGTMQGLWSIYYTEGISDPSREALKNVLHSLYEGLNVTIVELAVDHELAAERVNGRKSGSSRLDDLPAVAMRKKLRAVSPLTDAITGAARDARLQVLTFSGSDTPDALAARIQELT